MNDRFENSIRGPIPPGKAGLIMLAAAAIPVAIAAFKPLARALGKGLVSAGEALKDAAKEETKTATASRAGGSAKNGAEGQAAPAENKGRDSKASTSNPPKQSKPQAKSSKAKGKKRQKSDNVAQKTRPSGRRSVPDEFETG